MPIPLHDALAKAITTGTFGPYESVSAALNGMALYALVFPRLHDLSTAVADLPGRDRDTVHTYVADAATASLDLGQLLPKPATVKALLTAAKARTGLV